ncbi:DUF2817 domain-containing protein [Mesorhizobium sp. M0047]|uniref:DUF2817 domain-containing protein n=1 Tax=Mesorhizobium sp. M0047 TaxID=2956859 RepID=UPI0033380A05
MLLNCPAQLVPLLFSESYREARGKFVAASPATRAYGHRALGPTGENLFTDVAYLGPSAADNLLVLISATHGVEGYCGSACQLQFMSEWTSAHLPPSTAVLCIHALNPYGFAWDRRVTVEGCDLNRNFVDFDQPLPQNPGYEVLADCLVPPEFMDEAFTVADAQLAAYRVRRGYHEYIAAVSSGQYTRPDGLFFGGRGAVEARRILESIASDYEIERRNNVIIIDYHTGLGPYGYGELQCEHPSGLGGYERAAKIFGPSVTCSDLGTSSSVLILGTQDSYWERILGDRHTYVALEFGTYDVNQGLKVLRQDHCLFRCRPEEADMDLGRQIRTSAKLHYYPQGHDWKEMVLGRSSLVNRQAIAALGLAED